ncbi:Transposon Ty3-I Gag-Pol polyprotein [Gossypium australe]|uniref:Transposon Ty3-I Gag-Pol polyprotein n=1 Tax=Gossypium australe TaxID=47621 RepID=A0A5B6V3V3_9ROSI|nr:Transposon Ty3-I Gag-Pol polyprotein [Gossypium australe]
MAPCFTDQVIQTPEQQKWLGKLMGYDFEIRYRPVVKTAHHAIQSHPELQELCHRLQSNPQLLPEYAYKIYQQMKDSSLRPVGLLQPLRIPDLVFEDILMGCITGLPPSKGKTVIMVVVDRLSKYDYFTAFPGHFSNEMVVSTFVNDIMHLHGIPTTIVTDKDPYFMHTFWQELHDLQGTKLAMSTLYIPKQMFKQKLLINV